MREMIATRGGQTFLIVWVTQMISLIGSQLTSFGLGIWVYERTGSATDFALISVAAFLPGILLAPIAGAIVDRYDRRIVMLISDAVAGVSTALLAVLLFTGGLQIWHIYLAALISSSASAFQYPAYSAAITLLIPKSQYGRAAGMGSFAEGVSRFIGPALAGVLVTASGLHTLIAVDLLTFVFASITLLLVRFPALPEKVVSELQKRSLWKESLDGWRYLRDRRGLLGILLFFTFINFTAAFANVLTTPMVLNFGTPEDLGLIVSAAGVGIVIGSILMSIWGGPKQKLIAILGFGVMQGLSMIVFGFRESILLLLLSRFLLLIGNPIVNGSMAVLLQRKVAPEMQGRVFSTTRMLAWGSIPIALALSGPVADGIFEPAMMANGALAGTVGQIIGIGTGRGMALMFIIFGTLTLIGTGIAYLYPPVRRVEKELPDYDEPRDIDQTPPVIEIAAPRKTSEESLLPAAT